MALDLIIVYSSSQVFRGGQKLRHRQWNDNDFRRQIYLCGPTACYLCEWHLLVHRISKRNSRRLTCAFSQWASFESKTVSPSPCGRCGRWIDCFMVAYSPPPSTLQEISLKMPANGDSSNTCHRLKRATSASRPRFREKLRKFLDTSDLIHVYYREGLSLRASSKPRSCYTKLLVSSLVGHGHGGGRSLPASQLP